ncbi:GNAT family N-acetyltransferase [Comamonadaceae bacterium OTU4NAUVB1]|nr:GNAT family N-acetyltransferase [Comamonadaceae bacterium OTU4NAUVB1]
MSTTIRLAVEQDVDDLVAMGRDMHAESPRFRTMGFSETKVRRLLTMLQGTSPGLRGCMFVAERDGTLIGMALAILDQHLFHDERFVTDLVVFIKPTHRPSRAFPRLIQAIESWSIEQGAASVILGVSTGVHVEQTLEMYGRMGYASAGCTLSKTLAGD